jgi:hypothetical protein
MSDRNFMNRNIFLYLHLTFSQILGKLNVFLLSVFYVQRKESKYCTLTTKITVILQNYKIVTSSNTIFVMALNHALDIRKFKIEYLKTFFS